MEYKYAKLHFTYYTNINYGITQSIYLYEKILKVTCLSEFFKGSNGKFINLTRALTRPIITP